MFAAQVPTITDCISTYIYSGTKLMHGHAHERNWMKKTKDAGFIPGYVYKKKRLFSPFGSHGHDQHPLKPCSIALQPVGSRSRALVAFGPMELDENHLGVGNTGGLQGHSKSDGWIFF